MKKLWTLVLAGLLGGLLAGCGGTGVGTDPLADLPQAEDDLKAAALPLADEAEALFTDLMPAGLGLRAQADPPRALTLVEDSDGLVIIASLRGGQPTGGLEGPQALVIKCPSRSPCYAYLGDLRGNDRDGYRMVWYGGRERGVRQVREEQATVESRPVPPPSKCPPHCGPYYSKHWVKDRNGNWRWVYDKIVVDPSANNPTERHVVAPFPTDLPGEPLQRTLSATVFIEKLRQVVRGLRKPYDVEDPPAILLREDNTLAFAPYKNPRLSQARSIEELLDQDLGLLVLRVSGAGGYIPGAGIVSVRLVREGEKYFLIATDLRNPSQTARFEVGQVAGECPPGACYAPSPLYLGIEDRIGAGPLFQLRMGPLELRGIEKKDIR
jgi:hypothetical protein